MTNIELWDSFSDEYKKHFVWQVASCWRWKQYLKLYKKYFSSIEDMRKFGNWLKSQKIYSEILSKKHKGSKIKIEPLSLSDDQKEIIEEQNSEKNSIEDQLFHNRAYWYDENRDVYVVHIPSKKRPFALNGPFWRSIREAYSNWDDSAASVNEIARKFALPRNTVVALLRAMGVTHDSSPYTDEVIDKADEDALVSDLIRRKEEVVLVKAQQKEWNRIKRDALKYRNASLFTQAIRANYETLKQSDYEVERMSLKCSKKAFSLVLSPTDFHWGKLGPATDGDPYNRRIAKQRLFTTTEELFSRVSMRGRPEKIILGLGGDGLHIDNMNKQTTRGTPQDCDSSPMEMIVSYIELCREYIDYIRQFCDVDVYVINGNHDYYSSIFLREALFGWYNKVTGVEVKRIMRHRQTFLYGNSLITFVHGDDGNVKDYPAMIATEYPELWGKSKWRFIFTGHLHTERELPVYSDTVVYRMPSLASNDEWHMRKGYNSRKALIGYIVDKKNGVIATEISPV